MEHNKWSGALVRRESEGRWGQVGRGTRQGREQQVRDTIRHGGGVAERGESDWGRHDKTWGWGSWKGREWGGGGREHGTKRQVGWITWKGRELTWLMALVGSRRLASGSASMFPKSTYCTSTFNILQTNHSYNQTQLMSALISQWCSKSFLCLRHLLTEKQSLEL